MSNEPIPLLLDETDIQSKQVSIEIGHSVSVSSPDRNQVLFQLNQVHKETPGDTRISERDIFKCEVPIVHEGTKFKIKLGWVDEKIRAGQPGVTRISDDGDYFQLNRADGESWSDCSAELTSPLGQAIVREASYKIGRLQTKFNWKQNPQAEYAVEVLSKVGDRIKLNSR